MLVTTWRTNVVQNWPPCPRSERELDMTKIQYRTKVPECSDKWLYLGWLNVVIISDMLFIHRWHNLKAASGCQAKTLEQTFWWIDVVGRDCCWFRIVYCLSFCQVLSLAEKRQRPAVCAKNSSWLIDFIVYFLQTQPRSGHLFYFEGKIIAELHVFDINLVEMYSLLQ